MTLFLSVPEFLSQHAAIAHQQHLRQPWTIPLQDPTGRSHGYRQTVNLRPGLNVLIDDYTLQDDLLVETDGSSGDASLNLELSFMLSGENRCEKTPSRHNFVGAYWDSAAGGEFRWQAGERVLKFDIHMSADGVKCLVGEDCSALPAPLDQLFVTQQADRSFLRVGPTTAAMQSALHQILHCPYEGVTRWLFWESKILELLVLQLEYLRQMCPSIPPTDLRLDDVERIHQAKEILLTRLTDPPSLLELSRLVGLNDYKLKKGFRRVVGNTVFGCLRQHRLERARQLLLEGDISVTEAAIAVGYSSQGHFAAAFRKQFGVNPRALIAGRGDR